jgi:hypothetical protein
MIQDDKYCPEVLKQTYAVRRAIEKMEAMILEGHLHTCVASGIRDGREDAVISELMELYEIANGENANNRAGRKGAANGMGDRSPRILLLLAIWPLMVGMIVGGGIFGRRAMAATVTG